MNRLVVILSLLSFLAVTTAWATDQHALGDPGQSEALHHAQTGDSPHEPAASGCHVFHCQGAAHLSSIPSRLSFATSEDADTQAPASVVFALRLGILSTPWRPPTA